MSLGGVRAPTRPLAALAALPVMGIAASPAAAAKPPRVGGCAVHPDFPGPAFVAVESAAPVKTPC